MRRHPEFVIVLTGAALLLGAVAAYGRSLAVLPLTLFGGLLVITGLVLFMMRPRP